MTIKQLILRIRQPTYQVIDHRQLFHRTQGSHQPPVHPITIVYLKLTNMETAQGIPGRGEQVRIRPSKRCLGQTPEWERILAHHSIDLHLQAGMELLSKPQELPKAMQWLLNKDEIVIHACQTREILIMDLNTVVLVSIQPLISRREGEAAAYQLETAPEEIL